MPPHERNKYKPSNIENLDDTHFLPLLSHTWYFYKMFDITWCHKYDLSVLCLLYLCFINSFKPLSANPLKWSNIYDKLINSFSKQNVFLKENFTSCQIMFKPPLLGNYFWVNFNVSETCQKKPYYILKCLGMFQALKWALTSI